MRGIFIFISLLLFYNARSQQSTFNTALLLALKDSKQENQKQTFLVVDEKGLLENNSETYNYHVNYKRGKIASITCDLISIGRLSEAGLISRAELIKPMTRPLNDTMLKRNRILPVHQGQAPLQQAYDGSGVLLGFIDTGIDFNHPDFKDQNGKSRILFIWDQNQTAGSTVPQPYNYGIEWTKAQIDASVCTHSDVAYWGHGTHVAGIGAGNGLATNSHFGVAPKADIIMVALDFNKSGPTIADAVTYIFTKATALGKPCVINISLGDYYGSHDGTDLSTKLIENEITAMNGRAVIGAAGNAGSIRYHVKTQPQSGDTSFTWIEENSPTLSYFFYADTAQVKNLKISFGANRTNYSDLGNIGFKTHTYALNTLKTDTLKNNGNRIAIIKTAASINADGVYEFEAEISPDTANLLWRVETTGQGLHHAWNFSFVGSGLPTPSQYPRISKYISPDTLYSIVSGFQCSKEVVTVANYQNLQTFYDVKDSLQTLPTPAGIISVGSSLGPTRDNRQKPDIASSGQIIFSAGVLSLLPGLITNQPKDVAADSMHVVGGGTSAASPIVAGLAALYFQKNPQADHRMLIKAITECAYRDGFTGNALPDYQWGYGKLDGKNTLLCGENLAGLEKNKIQEGSSVYPNPFSEVLHARFSNSDVRRIEVYNTQGQLLLEQVVSAMDIVINDKLLQHQKGLIFVRIIHGGNTETFKVIKN